VRKKTLTKLIRREGEELQRGTMQILPLGRSHTSAIQPQTTKNYGRLPDEAGGKGCSEAGQRTDAMNREDE